MVDAGLKSYVSSRRDDWEGEDMQITQSKNHKSPNQKVNIFWRLILASLSLAILITVYLFQNFPWASHLAGILGTAFSENTTFIINKTVRVLINDNAAIVFIYAVFVRKEYVKLGLYVQLVEVLILLPLYLIFKLSLEGTSEISSPLLSQFHRLIINPTLMILLVFGFLYQKYQYHIPKHSDR